MKDSINIKFTDLQFAFFFKEDLIKKTDELSVSLREQFPIFDGDPLIIPLPSTAPKHIPMLELQSKDNKYRLTVAKERVDFYYLPENSEEVSSFSNYKSDFSNHLVNLFNFLNFINIRRLGYISTFFTENVDAVKTIQDIYIKKDIGDLAELSIRFNSQRDIDGIVVNDITILDQGELLTNSTKGIIIKRDINTVNEQEYLFNLASFNKFIDSSEYYFQTSTIISILQS